MATPTKSSNRSALNWLLIGGSLVSVFLWASLEDPFNAPKSWILYLVGLWLFGWVAFEIKGRWAKSTDRRVLLLGALFSFTLLIAYLATDVKLQGLFGDYARRTGLLSYLFLVIFFICAAWLFTLSNIEFFDRVILGVGFLIGFYGFLQHFKIDPIKWNNPYNSVLSTLGNPDFAAAVMAIFLVLAIGLVVNSTKKSWIRIWALLNILLLLVTILFSQVRQGLLASALGGGVILIVWIHQRQRLLALSLTLASALVGIVGLIGMLNKGPLKSFFYKDSVTYRGDYWRAGIRMFKSHPWFGVGLDRYGAYFREYRDSTQVLRRGPDLVSNAAHNVPIQLAATGGTFTLIAFLAITGFIFWRGALALRSTTGINQIVVATFFGAWIAYEAQSLISIDNLGIAIWGWILGGVVVGLSHDSVIEVVEEKQAAKVSQGKSAKRITSKPSGSLAQPMTSALLFLFGLSICIPMFLSDAAMKSLRGYPAPSASTAGTYLQIARKPLQYGFQDPHVKVSTSLFIAQAGSLDEGKANLRAVLARDPRSTDALDSLAQIDEQTKNQREAITYRQAFAKIDPLNYRNYLRLGEDLKAVGDTAGAKSMIAKIDSFAPHSDASVTAHKEFGSL